MMPTVVPPLNRLGRKKNQNKFGELLTRVLIVLLSHCLVVQGRPVVVRVVSHWTNFQNGAGFFLVWSRE